MNEEMRNTMENEETGLMELVETHSEVYNDSDSDGNHGLALVLGGVAAIGAAGALIYSKIKSKKEAKTEDKPKKKKTRKKLVWVEIEEPEEPVYESEEENFEDDEEEAEK